MKLEQLLWTEQNGWQNESPEKSVENPQLVLYFGSTGVLESGERYDDLKKRYPNSNLIGCTTSGEIIEEDVFDDSVVVTAMEFASTKTQIATLKIGDVENSTEAGKKLAEELNSDGLAGVMVISDGGMVNGSQLVKGLSSILGTEIPITGGLAGDGARFQKTLVGFNNRPEQGRIVAIGLYGDKITIGHGSVGGWDTFGPEREITRSKDNVLFELDGKPALELYKLYLGEEAANLPGSALLFPLSVRPKDSKEQGVVRTILTIDEEQQSMTFAGDLPEGYSAQLMRANFERLIDGAEEAAKIANTENEIDGEKLAILISCVGRKMVLGQRTPDEVEAVHELLGEDVAQIGFYSYGEISPHVEISGSCELHNQTMTITLLSENA
ncbi:MAG: hypothetical protein DWQ06_03165 [Calditrichaeota bacterium]|nr:MAG: hypothetical protein DWQ06_03165 [Calditrichota bacterium]